MTTRVLIAGIVGGIVMFLWNWLGHDVLPLGHQGVHFVMPNEAAVVDALKTNIGDGHGLYMFPGMESENPTSEQMKEAMKQLPEKLAANPSGLLIYHPPGRTMSFGRLLGVELGTDIVQAILVVFLLAQARIESFGGRVGFVFVAGILAAITTNISYWNWYGFPRRYTAAYMLIEVIGFFLVGIVAALMMGRRSSQTA